MKRHEKPLLTFIIDSKEQLPYRFSAPNPKRFQDGGFYVDNLLTADYTLEVRAERLPVLVERKSLADWFMTVGRERELFTARLARMRDADSAHVVIEATSEAIKAGYERSKVSGLSAWASVYHWSVMYGVHFHTVGNRRMGQLVTQRILEEFAWHWCLAQSENKEEELRQEK